MNVYEAIATRARACGRFKVKTLPKMSFRACLRPLGWHHRQATGRNGDSSWYVMRPPERDWAKPPMDSGLLVRRLWSSRVAPRPTDV